LTQAVRSYRQVRKSKNIKRFRFSEVLTQSGLKTNFGTGFEGTWTVWPTPLSDFLLRPETKKQPIRAYWRGGTKAKHCFACFVAKFNKNGAF
jgi:hypothetical protein